MARLRLLPIALAPYRSSPTIGAFSASAACSRSWCCLPVLGFILTSTGPSPVAGSASTSTSVYALLPPTGCFTSVTCRLGARSSKATYSFAISRCLNMRSSSCALLSSLASTMAPLHTPSSRCTSCSAVRELCFTSEVSVAWWEPTPRPPWTHMPAGLSIARALSVSWSTRESRQEMLVPRQRVRAQRGMSTSCSLCTRSPLRRVRPLNVTASKRRSFRSELAGASGRSLRSAFMTFIWYSSRESLSCEI
jgi:hypothetical protein